METESKPAGRPRDQAAADAAKAAALRLMRARGYAGVSISAIAAEAGVARQTLYNRWNAKAELVLEALMEDVERYSGMAEEMEGEGGRAQLEAFLTRIFDHLSKDGLVLRSLIAAAQEDAAFRDHFREKFVKPREKIVTDLLRRAQARGEIGAGRDPKMLSGFVHGAFWYALLNGQPVDAALARRIAAEVFGG